jgi:hypothetical protein
MRRFNNTKEITIITFQATLTTMFVVGALRVLFAIVTGDITNASFGAY